MATIPNPAESRSSNSQIRGFHATAQRLKLDPEEILEYGKRLLKTYEDDMRAISSPGTNNPHAAEIGAEAALLKQCIQKGNFEALKEVTPR